MKGLDPTIETVGCGSSTNWLPTYPEWDRIVLEECWNHIDYISAHHYSRNDDDDTASFLAQGIELDAIITQYRGLIDHVSALKRSFHRVHVSFDEWNVWYREMPTRGDFQEAPHLLEETYNLQDALVCAQYLHAFLRHADIVKVACIAQIVNVIAPDPHPPRRPPRAEHLLAVPHAARRRHRRRPPRRRPGTRDEDDGAAATSPSSTSPPPSTSRPGTDRCPSSTATRTSPSTSTCGSRTAP